VQLKRAGGIQNATLLRRGSWDLVTFTWPGEATSVELRTFPAEQPFDPDVPPLVSVSQDRYRTEGGCVVPGGLPAEGATVYLNSLTYHEGKQISSPPVDLEAPPLWRYEYTLRWPLMNRVLGIGNLFGALVEIEVVARAGIKKQEDAASVSLIHNPDHFPLHAGDGQPVPDDGELRELVVELSSGSGHFQRLWEAHDVMDQRAGVLRLHHPVVGDVEVFMEATPLAADPGLTLVVLPVAPGSPSARALARLKDARRFRATNDAGAG